MLNDFIKIVNNLVLLSLMISNWQLSFQNKTCYIFNV